MTSSPSRQLDVVVFGATGFTGKEVVKRFGELKLNIRWAVGGRRLAALEEVVQACGVPNGAVVADVADTESLKRMAKSTRLVLNATGPYRFFGEAVVQACVEEGTDYADLCGEPEFMENMLLKYGDSARQNGAIICHACAFDSVPADMGILHCAQLFQKAGGVCGHVEMFHSVDAPMGYSAHATTFFAAVHGIGAAKYMSTIRKQLDEKHGKIPKGSSILGPLPKRSGSYFWEPRLQSYAVPFIGADASVVRSSRRVLANILQVDDAEELMPQFGIYFTMKSWFSLLKMTIVGLMFYFLAARSWGRRLLIRFPSFFTFGAFSEAGPTKEQMLNNTWKGDFYASGTVDGAKKELVLHAELRDPGYIGTGMLFAMTAQTMLEDRSKLTAQGGVFTPAGLFKTSSLLDRLAAHGMKFEVVKSDLN